MITQENHECINKPGFIKNEELIDLEISNFYRYNLRLNLQEIHDYITLPKAAWLYLSSWYNYDFWISKELVQNITDPNTWVLNLYPDENEIDVEISKNPSYVSRSKCKMYKS